MAPGAGKDLPDGMELNPEHRFASSSAHRGGRASRFGTPSTRNPASQGRGDRRRVHTDPYIHWR